MSELRDRLIAAMNAALKDDPADGMFDREGLVSDMIDIIWPLIEAELQALVSFHEGETDLYAERIAQKDAEIAAAYEAAAKVIDECNLEGPYQAIGAAERIRALTPASALAARDARDAETWTKAQDAIAGMVAAHIPGFDKARIAQSIETWQAAIERKARLEGAREARRLSRIKMDHNPGPNPVDAYIAALAKTQGAGDGGRKT